MSRRRRRRSRASAWLRTLLGLALAPTSVGALLVSAAALGGLTGSSRGAGLFLCGLAGYALLHAAGLLRLRRFYVFSHELTHALAAWMFGARVLSFVVRGESGHVDLSRSNIFISLAPYWVPFYSLSLVLAYRLLLWVGPPAHLREVFLTGMGASIAFHLAHTVESLWATHQSDLDEAGIALSMALIALLNGVFVLGALKCLFPRLVSLSAALSRAGEITRTFWTEAASLAARGVS